jgi:hypothetical protein
MRDAIFAMVGFRILSDVTQAGDFAGWQGCKVEGGSRGYHPCYDRKSAESLDNTGNSGAPLRKRVRKFIKTLGLQGCNKKERVYEALCV